MAPLSYRRHRFPPEVIQQAIWLYLRFTLSYRDVEELLAERGLDVSYETVRRWVLKFGPLIAQRLRQRRPRPSKRWHLDEMVVRIAGQRMYLWRAVDDEGEILDMLVQRRRDTRAALRLMRKLLKKQGLRAEIAGYRQAAVLFLGISASPVDLPARTGAEEEQSGREFAPTRATAAAQNATLQISRVSPALPFRSRRRLQHFQRPASSDNTMDPPSPSRCGDEHMAKGRHGCISSCDDGLSRP